MKFVVFFMLAIFIIGCIDKSVSFSTVLQGSNSGIIEKNNFAIHTESEWNDFWKTFTGPSLNMQKPEINFSFEMTIAVFSGEKRTGGYSILVDKIIQRNGKIFVYIKEIQPPAGSVVTMALTQPFHIVKMPKSERPIDFLYE